MATTMPTSLSAIFPYSSPAWRKLRLHFSTCRTSMSTTRKLRVPKLQILSRCERNNYVVIYVLSNLQIIRRNANVAVEDLVWHILTQLM